MKTILLAIACWNTIVALINVFVLPLFTAPEVLVYITPLSQILPVAIPLMLWACIAFKCPIDKVLTFIADGHGREFAVSNDN
jgi:hypothetical protein